MKEHGSNVAQAFYLYPLSKPFCALHCAQPDCFRRDTGNILRVMPTLMCARVTSLDSAQALPKNRKGSDLSPPNPTAGVTLPRPLLRTFSPKNPTKGESISLNSLIRLQHYINGVMYHCTNI